MAAICYLNYRNDIVAYWYAVQVSDTTMLHNAAEVCK